MPAPVPVESQFWSAPELPEPDESPELLPVGEPELPDDAEGELPEGDEELPGAEDEPELLLLWEGEPELSELTP